MKTRRGFTLIEMCIVIALLSAIMALAAVIIHGLMGSNHLAREAIERQTTLGALAETFRGDVHAAAEFRATGSDTSPRWELKPQNGPAVVYRLQATALVRETTSSEGPAWRSFLLNKGTTVAVEDRREGETTFVTLMVRPASTAAGAPGRAATGLLVEARLARDQRLADDLSSAGATAEPEKESSDE